MTAGRPSAAAQQRERASIATCEGDDEGPDDKV
ncbi:MAG: hypothetical protein K0R97_3155, partial [Oerskovia sp.]|nr:hypothetical protein [Oerskovia sp.]